MGFFNDIGKFIGGIATAVVPGFSTIAKTGIFGDDLAAISGAPQAGPVAAAIASSPNLLATELAPRLPPIRVAPAALPPGAIPGLSGRTVNIPVEYLTVLRDAARQGSASPAFVDPGTYIPPQAVTALSLGQAVTPLEALGRLAPTIPSLAIASRFSSALGLF